MPLRQGTSSARVTLTVCFPVPLCGRGWNLPELVVQTTELGTVGGG